jgi:hypothetical protein
MRPMPAAATATLLIAAAFACSPHDRQETASRVDTAAEDVRDAAREGADEVRDEARDARDYAYAERNDFRRDIDLRLKGFDEEIAQFERDTKRGVDKGRDSLLVNIRTARRAVDRNLDRLAAATENDWDAIKSDVNGSVYALQEAVRRARPDAKPMGGTGPQ